MDGSIDSVSMLYHIAFDEFGNRAFSYRRNCLVKRDRNFKWIGPVHEYLEVSGNIISSDISVTHRQSEKSVVNTANDRNLIIYEKRSEREEEFSLRDLFYYANELKDHGLYQKSVIYYRYCKQKHL
ncbi:hypothetical protein MKY30_15725 [Oceanobacillus sp. FSL W8-0428]|uniref:hypothetical protein n=1 Tax=Oceanobacillus sp. FSL W8-0428 TaxID=2921715 RepID=UPI0030F53857